MLTQLKIKDIRSTENNHQKNEREKKDDKKIGVCYYHFKVAVFVKHKHVKGWISFDQPN